MLVRTGDIDQFALFDRIDGLICGAARFLGTLSPMRWIILTRRWRTHERKTSDTMTPFRSVNVVFAGAVINISECYATRRDRQAACSPRR